MRLSTVSRTAANAVLFVLCSVSTTTFAADSDFPKPTGLASVLPKTFDVQIEPLKATAVFYTSNDHLQVFHDHLGSSDERALLNRRCRQLFYGIPVNGRVCGHKVCQQTKW